MIDNVEQKSMREFTEYAYLNYSMYVILDRALPHIADGLKPVQRRIIYAMSELGLKNTAKYKKSARTVGDVIGKFHPHGDAACYEALVLMAQPFSYRYPLIEGQGNFGSPDDPKSFAAMRYTESRLSAFADALLAELEQGTSEWTLNFDGTLKEPVLLPSRLPHILLNGATGIAVGMATDIPPHNLKEIAEGCIYLLDRPQASLEEITGIIHAPDFPGGAEIITPQEDILKFYQTGSGTLRLRATHQKEEDNIVITALPHQVSGDRILEQIALQMREKKLPMIEDLRDESDHENPTRLVIMPKSSRVDGESLMAHLFATTDLEKTYKINLNMIGLDGRPQVKNLLEILKEWLTYRLQTVMRRLQYRLDKALARLHLLEGLLTAYLNIEKVIQIIRFEDEPKPELIKAFALSAEQAEAILELKLRHLAKLEESQIKKEQNLLYKEKTALEKLLNSEKNLKHLIKQELQQDAEKYGDMRRSSLIVGQEAQALNFLALQPVESVTVILSQMGWVRLAKGHEVDANSLNYKSGDALKMTAIGKNNQQAVFLDSTGRSYSITAYTLPSARGQGEPLTGRLNTPAGAVFAGVLLGAETDQVILASSAGYGFAAALSDLYCKNRNGKTLLKLTPNSTALPPCLIKNFKTDSAAVLVDSGQLLIFPVKELSQLQKGKGNRLISLKKTEKVLDIVIMSADQTLILIIQNPNKNKEKTLILKPAQWKAYQGKRAQRGKKLPRRFQQANRITVQS